MTSQQGKQTSSIIIIDHNFMGIPGTIASYLIPHSEGAVLIESGPGSTVQTLTQTLSTSGIKPEDISDVLLTHIHLDHAGAAGWLAQHGSRIHVHHVGAPHMINPEKLLKSASRIYGDQMETLWGDFIPVPGHQINQVGDGDIIQINELQFRAVDTPGHANHHHAYIHDNICFSGDIGGIRMDGPRHIRLPMPPPEFNLELWRNSQQKLYSEYTSGSFSKIAPTHFGIYDDPEWHLREISTALDEIDQFIDEVLPQYQNQDELNHRFLQWTRLRSLDQGLTPEELEPYEAANPSWMSTFGIYRYWQKLRNKKTDG